MIFWIILIVLAVAAICVAGFFARYDAWYGRTIRFSVRRFLSTLISGVGIGAVILSVYSAVAYEMVGTTGYTTTTTSLQALKTDSETSGRSYFLGGGYINQNRVLNYISKDDGGAIRLDSVYVERATIYEGYDDPRMETYDFYSDSILVPWRIDNRWLDNYSFFVPTGSVLTDDYTVDNN